MATGEVKKTLSYSEQLDIPQVTLSEAAMLLRLQIEFMQHRGPLILVGESGIGKTQMIHQVARDEKYDVRVINTAQFGLMGTGIPLKAVEEFFKIAVPEIFPRKGENSIVFFDEINRGLKHAIAMFFNMLEDRRMFNYVLPDSCIVAGAMNPATLNYQVTPIEKEPAIRRRLKFLYIIPGVRGWLNHAETPEFHRGSKGPAKNKPCHPSILSFFRAQPKLICDAKTRDAGKQYTCPATIETISEDAYILDAKRIPLDGEVARMDFGSSIGLTVATQLLTHIKDSTIMIGADDILYRYKKASKGVKHMVAKHLHEPLADLCVNVLTLMFADASPTKIKTVSGNFLKFCLDIPNEMRANMLFQLKETAVQNNAQSYLDDLMGVLQEEEKWIEIQKSIDKSHRDVDDKIRKATT